MSKITFINNFIVQITDYFGQVYTVNRNGAPDHIYEGMPVDINYDSSTGTIIIEDIGNAKV